MNIDKLESLKKMRKLARLAAIESFIDILVKKSLVQSSKSLPYNYINKLTNKSNNDFTCNPYKPTKDFLKMYPNLNDEQKRKMFLILNANVFSLQLKKIILLMVELLLTLEEIPFKEISLTDFSEISFILEEEKSYFEQINELETRFNQVFSKLTDIMSKKPISEFPFKEIKIDLKHIFFELKNFYEANVEFSSKKDIVLFLSDNKVKESLNQIELNIMYLEELLNANNT